MKKKSASMLALVLAVGMLCGCGVSGESRSPETTVPAAAEITVPETIATETTVPETTIPETSVPETTVPETAPYEITITPVITAPQTQVEVKTADEFLAAIASDTEIILAADLIDLSTATGYGKVDGAHYRWEESYDGPELRIVGVSNLTIRGSGADHNGNQISSDPRYAYVLLFENCSNIHVTGFTAGHSKEPGYCAGGVLGFQNSQDILVEDCGLYGCGTLGVMGASSKNMQIMFCDIYECSVGGVEFTNCDDVKVDGCTFRDLGTPEYPGTEFRVYGCGTITCNGEPVRDFNPRNLY